MGFSKLWSLLEHSDFSTEGWFLGVGWSGRNCLAATVQAGAAEVVGIADSAAEIAAEAIKLAPGAEVVSTLDEWRLSGAHIDVDVVQMGEGFPPTDAVPLTA